MKRTKRQYREEVSIRLRMRGCSKCGKKPSHRKYVKQMHFHHVDASTKVDSPANLLGRIDDVFFTELRKCVVYCACCHIEVHVDQDDLGKRSS